MASFALAVLKSPPPVYVRYQSSHCSLWIHLRNNPLHHTASDLDAEETPSWRMFSFVFIFSFVCERATAYRWHTPCHVWLSVRLTLKLPFIQQPYRGKKITLTTLCISKSKQINERGELYPHSPRLFARIKLTYIPLFRKAPLTLFSLFMPSSPILKQKGWNDCMSLTAQYFSLQLD